MFLVKSIMPVPKYDDLFDSLLKAMHQLGGSASVGEQEDAVASILGLTNKELSEIHRGNRSKLVTDWRGRGTI